MKIGLDCGHDGLDEIFGSRVTIDNEAGLAPVDSDLPEAPLGAQVMHQVVGVVRRHVTSCALGLAEEEPFKIVKIGHRPAREKIARTGKNFPFIDSRSSYSGAVSRGLRLAVSPNGGESVRTPEWGDEPDRGSSVISRLVVTDMRRILATYLLVIALGLPVPAAAQAPLTLTDAIARARAQNSDARSSAAAEREAAQRMAQARAGYWPKVDVAESWQRGNQPVFVFSSLLAQRQFTAADFALDALNHPDALDNFRTAVTVEQPLFDGVARANVTVARIGHEMASATRQMVDHDLAASVTAAYGRALIAAGARRSADAAVDTARADRELAGNRRDAGLVTDADVLQIDVHLSRAREQQIVAASDERIARAQLNQLIGAPLGEAFVLDPAPVTAAIAALDLAVLEAEAIKARPDVTLAVLQEQRARAGQTAARAAYFPHVSAQGGWEWNGGEWTSRSSAWVLGAVARVNLFNGFADKARLAEAADRAARYALERDKVETAARLDVHVAVARLEAARASEAVGRDAVVQARESRRIIRDRYEAGLTDVASLLRSAEAVARADAQQVAAQVALLTASADLQRALGRR